MNLTDVLAQAPSATTLRKVTGYIGNDPKRFAELVRLFLAGPYRLTQRAAGPLLRCVQNKPQLVQPHLRTFLKQLAQPGQHDSIKRNVLRLLQHIEIPIRLQGVTADTAFRLLADRSEPVAIRVFAMTVSANLAKHQPALANELCLLIEDELPYGTAAFVSRGTKTLKLLRSARGAARK